eukprot:TRINITY_DN957_c1_g1_i1.p1 TRINITY_DN957_c1_g1~~TRINITY_DN957_c1_g1_i1.p1  ORF type:complete len:157 (+),score=1.12 TRINITY_DN957_c1_g1_i1:47-472(+)
MVSHILSKPMLDMLSQMRFPIHSCVGESTTLRQDEQRPGMMTMGFLGVYPSRRYLVPRDLLENILCFSCGGVFRVTDLSQSVVRPSLNQGQTGREGRDVRKVLCCWIVFVCVSEGGEFERAADATVFRVFRSSSHRPNQQE